MVYRETGRKDLARIVSVLEKHGVLTIKEIAKYTQMNRETAGRRVAFWFSNGKLFRVARSQYALTPDAKPKYVPTKADLRSRRRNPSVELMYECFNNMVRVGA